MYHAPSPHTGTSPCTSTACFNKYGKAPFFLAIYLHVRRVYTSVLSTNDAYQWYGRGCMAEEEFPRVQAMLQTLTASARCMAGAVWRRTFRGCDVRKILRRCEVVLHSFWLKGRSGSTRGRIRGIQRFAHTRMIFPSILPIMRFQSARAPELLLLGACYQWYVSRGLLICLCFRSRGRWHGHPRLDL